MWAMLMSRVSTHFLLHIAKFAPSFAMMLYKIQCISGERIFHEKKNYKVGTFCHDMLLYEMVCFMRFYESRCLQKLYSFEYTVLLVTVLIDKIPRTIILFCL